MQGESVCVAINLKPYMLMFDGKTNATRVELLPRVIKYFPLAIRLHGSFSFNSAKPF